MTPKLWIEPLDWCDLTLGKAVDLDGWIMLRQDHGRLVIAPLHKLKYPLFSNVEAVWPKIGFSAFYGNGRG